MAKWPPARARFQTMAMASSDPAKASSSVAPTPANVSDGRKKTAIAPPSAAPPDAPSTKGSASGLRNSPWKSTPVAESAAPDQPRRKHARQAQRKQNDSGVSRRRRMQQRAQHLAGRELHRTHPGRRRQSANSSSTAGSAMVEQHRWDARSARDAVLGALGGPVWSHSFQLSPPKLN